MTAPRDITPLLDPEIMAALAPLNLRFGKLSHATLPKVRSAMAGLAPPSLSEAVSRVDHSVVDRSPVTVRVHRAKSAQGLLPCIYWMHGGGLVLGRAVGDDPRFDDWCPRLDCVGASVEYRLAPESTYPQPLEDCYAGLRWLHAQAETLGIDRNRIGIGGSSAGAGLAAGLALLARDRGELSIAFQALIYPMIDDRQQTVSSHWQDPVWPPNANRFGWDCYLGGLTGDAVPAYAAAARAVNLEGLPPTFISVGALDVFADEDIDYAVRLRHAGVPTELHVYPGAPHGFDALTPNTTLGRRSRGDLDTWLVGQLRIR